MAAAAVTVALVRAAEKESVGKETAEKETVAKVEEASTAVLLFLAPAAAAAATVAGLGMQKVAKVRKAEKATASAVMGARVAAILGKACWMAEREAKANI
jgi:hypothetical protein